MTDRSIPRELQPDNPLFELGQIVLSRGVVAFAPNEIMRFGVYLSRHHAGDWGVIDEHDQRVNPEAQKHGGRLMSAYAIDPQRPSLGHGPNTIWIITEADRQTTTLLLPEEY
jgi:hypothetical protein